MSNSTEKTTLYRYYNSDNQLLYVGITKNLFQRQDQHSRTQPWWSDVAVASFEHFDDRVTALAFEDRAIYEEWPIHNKAGNTISPEDRRHLLSLIDGDVQEDHRQIAQSLCATLEQIEHLEHIALKLRWLFAFDRAIAWDRNGEYRETTCPQCIRILESNWFAKTLYIADGLVCHEMRGVK